MRIAPPVPPSDGEPPRYRSTRFDKLGPDAGLDLRLGGLLVMVALVCLFISWLVATRTFGLRGPVLLFSVTLGTVGGTALVRLAVLKVLATTGAFARMILFPSGSSVPYDEQYSYQQAMAERGDIAGALESYEAVIAERPEAWLPRLRAAELYAGGGRDPARAAELFRSVRDLPAAPLGQVLVASHRLVDLYDGPLHEPGRALVELRRIVERFPGTPAAEHARRALPRLKAYMAAELERPVEPEPPAS